jgi:hypothetical protein
MGFCITTELVGIQQTEFLVWYNTMDCASVCVCVCVCVVPSTLDKSPQCKFNTGIHVKD